MAAQQFDVDYSCGDEDEFITPATAQPPVTTTVSTLQTLSPWLGVNNAHHLPWDTASEPLWDFVGQPAWPPDKPVMPQTLVDEPLRQTETPSPFTQAPPSTQIFTPLTAPLRAPDTETRAPVQVTRAPETEIQAPIQETRAPDTETRAPVQETRAPVRETRVPVRETRVPVGETRVPPKETHSPLRETRARVTETRNSMPTKMAESAPPPNRRPVTRSSGASRMSQPIVLVSPRMSPALPLSASVEAEPNHGGVRGYIEVIETSSEDESSAHKPVRKRPASSEPCPTSSPTKIRAQSSDACSSSGYGRGKDPLRYARGASSESDDDTAASANTTTDVRWAELMKAVQEITKELREIKEAFVSWFSSTKPPLPSQPARPSEDAEDRVPWRKLPPENKSKTLPDRGQHPPSLPMAASRVFSPQSQSSTVSSGTYREGLSGICANLASPNNQLRNQMCASRPSRKVAYPIRDNTQITKLVPQPLQRPIAVPGSRIALVNRPMSRSFGFVSPRSVSYSSSQSVSSRGVDRQFRDVESNICYELVRTLSEGEVAVSGVAIPSEAVDYFETVICAETFSPRSVRERERKAPEHLLSCPETGAERCVRYQPMLTGWRTSCKQCAKIHPFEHFVRAGRSSVLQYLALWLVENRAPSAKLAHIEEMTFRRYLLPAD